VKPLSQHMSKCGDSLRGTNYKRCKGRDYESVQASGGKEAILAKRT